MTVSTDVDCSIPPVMVAMVNLADLIESRIGYKREAVVITNEKENKLKNKI
jgi:hypothetical protein